MKYRDKLIIIIVMLIFICTCTGCITEAEINEVVSALEEENVIDDDWKYIESLAGLGKGVGGEDNLPKYNSTFRVYQDGNAYILVQIDKLDKDDTYEVYVYLEDVEYGKDPTSKTKNYVYVKDYSEKYSVSKSFFGFGYKVKELKY